MILLVKCDICSDSSKTNSSKHRVFRKVTNTLSFLKKNNSIQGHCRVCGEPWEPFHAYRHDLAEIAERLKRLEAYYEES
jgi:hypothetical protein